MKKIPFTYDNPFDATDSAAATTRLDGRTRTVYHQPFGRFAVSDEQPTSIYKPLRVLSIKRTKNGTLRLTRFR